MGHVVFVFFLAFGSAGLLEPPTVCAILVSRSYLQLEIILLTRIASADITSMAVIMSANGQLSFSLAEFFIENAQLVPIKDVSSVRKGVQSSLEIRILNGRQIFEYFPLFWRKNEAHNESMTDLLEQAVERVRALPPETQDDFARVLLRLAGDEGPVYLLTAEEEADLAAADEEIARGELATDEQVQAMWAKLGL